MITRTTALAALATLSGRIQRLNVAQDPTDAAKLALEEFISQAPPPADPPQVTENTGAEAEFAAGREDAKLTPTPSGTESPIRLAGRIYQDFLDGKLAPRDPGGVTGAPLDTTTIQPTAPAAPTPTVPVTP